MVSARAEAAAVSALLEATMKSPELFGAGFCATGMILNLLMHNWIAALWAAVGVAWAILAYKWHRLLLDWRRLRGV